MASSSETFCLQWNEFGTNISESLKSVRNDKEFFNVTLLCEDNQIEAHKLILAACSPFFRSILRRNPHHHPLLYLKGVRYKEIEAILNFMYMGQVNVAETELESFLAVAADLKVRGLTKAEDNFTRSHQEKDPAPVDFSTASSSKSSSYKNGNHVNEINIKSEVEENNYSIKSEIDDNNISHNDQQMLVNPSKSHTVKENEVDLEPVVTIHHHAEDESFMDQSLDGSQISGRFPVDYTDCYADYSKDWYTIVNNKMKKSNNTWICCDCQYSSRNKTSLISHVEGKHIDDFPGYLCTICGTRSGTYCGFEKHMSRQHKYSLARKTSMNVNIHQESGIV